MADVKSSGISLRFGGVLLLAAACLLLSAFFLFQNVRPRTYFLKITGGDALGRRATLAKLLAAEGDAHSLQITVRETSGSVEALKAIESGHLDAALIQGGIPAPPHVHLVAALALEPMHLLVKKEIAAGGLNGLRGKRINLSTKGSGTRLAALAILKFAGLSPGADFTDEDKPYSELELSAYDALPDAVFTISLLPSPIADYLVRKHGYRLIPLPFGEAIALREPAIFPATIPAYACRVSPPEPPAAIPTVANRLLLVARDDTPPEAVSHLLEAIFQSGFVFRANIPAPDEKKILDAPEYPIHPGATDYLRRNDPFLTAAVVQSLESLRSLLFSLAIGLFLLWRWNRQRRFEGFDRYIAEVTELEKRALALETEATLNLRELILLRNRLSAVKTEALEKFAAGQLRGEELMTSFLAHVTDVRHYVATLLNAERERLTVQTADLVDDKEQQDRFKQEWQEALGEAGFP